MSPRNCPPPDMNGSPMPSNPTAVALPAAIDDEVAQLVKNRADDFYKKYSYLKPDNGLIRFIKGALELKEKLDDWARRHWKFMVTIAIAILVIVILITSFPFVIPTLAVTVCKGALYGMAIGGYVGGAMSSLMGGDFFQGVEEGAFTGAIAGIVSAFLGFKISVGGKFRLSLYQNGLVGGVSALSASLASDVGDIAFKGEKIPPLQVFDNSMRSFFSARFSQ